MATLNQQHHHQQQQQAWLPASMQKQPSLTSANSSGGCLGNPLPSVEMPLPSVRPQQAQQQPGQEAEGEASLVSAASPLPPLTAGCKAPPGEPCSSPPVSHPPLPAQHSLQGSLSGSHGSPAAAAQRNFPPSVPNLFLQVSCGPVRPTGEGGGAARAASLPCPVASPFLAGVMQRSATHPGQLPGGAAGSGPGLAIPSSTCAVPAVPPKEPTCCP